MSDWNPELYLKFERERTQPVRDLAGRIEMASPKNIIDWIQSTGMRPFLDRLPADHHEAFKAKVLERIIKSYPSQKDGKVLFVFKRLFFIACKV